MSKRLNEMRARMQSESAIPDDEIEAALAVVEAAERWEEARCGTAPVDCGEDMYMVFNKAITALSSAVRAFRGEEEGT